MRPMGGWLPSPLRVYLHDVKKGQIKIIERKKKSLLSNNRCYNYYFLYCCLVMLEKGLIKGPDNTSSKSGAEFTNNT